MEESIKSVFRSLYSDKDIVMLGISSDKDYIERSNEELKPKRYNKYTAVLKHGFNLIPVEIEGKPTKEEIAKLFEEQLKDYV